MGFHLFWFARIFAFIVILSGVVNAAPYASYVMDARSGKEIYAANANTPLHPASLTKMMTLYVVFEAVRRGEITLETQVRISPQAAGQPPSRLGLKTGQLITVRHLVRATAVKSANDAALALAEAVSGSQSAFATRMNGTAKALGMKRTHFKNPHGLTQSGHYSTARDMALLGRRLFYDHPEYYNLFSRLKTHAGIRNVSNTNHRLLNNYPGADGIKTGYTRAAGHNLVASAYRGNKRVIVSFFGGKSGSDRADKVAQLLNYGFQKSPRSAPVRKPRRIRYLTPAPSQPAMLVGYKTRSAARQNESNVRTATKRQTPRALDTRITRARPAPARSPAAAPQVAAATIAPLKLTLGRATRQPPIASVARPTPRPGRMVAAATASGSSEGVAEDMAQEIVAQLASEQAEASKAAAQKGAGALQLASVARPSPRPQMTIAQAARTQAQTKPENSRAGVRGNWSVRLGKYNDRGQAERLLLRAALQDVESLGEGARHVIKIRERGQTLYEARFVGLSQADANKACARMRARNSSCEPLRQ